MKTPFDRTPFGAAACEPETEPAWTLAGSLRENAPFMLLVLIYVAVAMATFAVMGLPLIRPGAYLGNSMVYLASATMALCLPYLHKLATLRPESPVALAMSLGREWRLQDRFILALPAIAALIVFMPAFSAFKSAIPAVAAFTWDPLFVRMDEAIHGQDPWRLLHPVIGNPPTTFLLNVTYHLWVLLPYIGVLLVAGWVEQPRLRMRFFLTYALSWALLGTLGAILTASVGPCFYDDFYGSDRFAPLMSHLAEVDRSLPLMTLVMQEQLLFWAQAGSNGLGRGISAMPSMHISIAFLFALVGWRVSRLWGGFATAFLILIFIGSIQTGYHYAVDAYAAVAGTLALWWVAGRVVSTLYRRRNAPSQQGVPVAVSAAAE